MPNAKWIVDKRVASSSILSLINGAESIKNFLAPDM